jgi:hypothetical protein
MFHRDFIALLKSFNIFICYVPDCGENIFSRQYSHSIRQSSYKDFIAEDELCNKLANLVNFGKEKADFIDYYGEWYCNYN